MAKYSPEKYAARVARTGLTRRAEITRNEIASAYVGHKVSWREAQRTLPDHILDMITRTVKLSRDEKIRKAEKNLSDYVEVMKKWDRAIRNVDDPALKETLKRGKKLAELKLVWGKKALTNRQYIVTSEYLKMAGVDDDKIEQYWGY